MQKYIHDSREFCILYERHPMLSSGEIINLSEKISSSTNMLVALNVGKCSIRDYSRFNTKYFTQLIDNITKKIHNFYVGRYDVKAKNLQELF